MNPAKEAKRNRFAFLVCLLPILSPSLTLADEGTLEINQTCAVNGGCFEGDDSGFPVEITESGSYVLTSNLDVTVAPDPPNTDGIAIAAHASEVAINLNGFSIFGPVSCSGSPLECIDTGFGDGILARSEDGSRTYGVTVRDGAVRGMGDNGMLLGRGATVIGVNATENGGTGIFTRERSMIRNVVALSNGGHGVIGNSEGVIQNVRATGNGRDGINSGGTVTNSVASFNDSNGIASISVHNCIAEHNSVDGIFLFGARGKAIDSTAFDNGDDGIDCANGGAIKGNDIASNAAQAIRNCTEIGPNFCDGGLCP